MKSISPADLILNADGSIYHLNLLPDDIAGTIILVGDPERVATVSKYFDRVEIKKSKREFVLHTGYLNNVRLSCLSTGMGPDNIDIALNELDALVNTDLVSRAPLAQRRSLKLVRIGTSGAIQPDVPIGSVVVSRCAVACDTLMSFYNYQPEIEEQYLQQAFQQHIKGALPAMPVYASFADEKLLARFAAYRSGCTYTAVGFYGPQGRKLNNFTNTSQLLDVLMRFTFAGHCITNIEMETAAIYALSKMMGHRALSLNIILANRTNGVFSENPHKQVDDIIPDLLEILAQP